MPIDIYDIKTIFFWFIYSLDYFIIIFIIVFFIWFYFLLNYFLYLPRKENFKKEIIVNDEDLMWRRLKYIQDNIANFSKEVFYREFSLFIKTLIFNVYKDKSIFFMTLDEIEKKYKSKYIEIFKEVYFLEFDKSKEDNINIRNNLLSKVIIIYNGKN